MNWGWMNRVPRLQLQRPDSFAALSSGRFEPQKRRHTVRPVIPARSSVIAVTRATFIFVRHLDSRMRSRIAGAPHLPPREAEATDGADGAHDLAGAAGDRLGDAHLVVALGEALDLGVLALGVYLAV